MTSSASSSKRTGSVGRNVTGSHKRDAVVVASPAKHRYEIELPLPRMPSSITNAGATPIFELSQDPLEDSRNTPRPTDYSNDQNGVASTPNGKKRSFNEGISHISAATQSSIRSQHSTTPHDRRASVPAFAQSVSIHSPSSSKVPTRQSSMSKSASQNAHDAVSGRNTPQSAAYIGARPDSANAISRRHVASPETVMDRQYSHSSPFEDVETDDDEQDKGHGARRQSSINNSGRWTPTILSGIIKKAGSPIYAFGQSASKQKGHTDEKEGLTETEMHQGRKTPAKYQPPHDKNVAIPTVSFNQGYDYYPPTTHSVSQSYRASHPLSHAHKISTSTIGSNSSHSIQMQSPTMQSHSSPRLASNSGHTSMHTLSPIMQQKPVIENCTASTANSSPLVVPHARRGAINLRPERRRKRAALARRRRAAALAAQSPKVSTLRQLQRTLSVLIKALLCPSETARSIALYLQSTLHSIDMSFRDTRTGKRVWRPSWLGAYIPLLIWLVVSLGSTTSVIIWHTEVFQALDRLSTHLQEMGLAGRFLLGSLIFLTTFPPLPLYSTLIILCGFSFGLVQGFIISYVAALSGAIVVFVLSRSLLKNWMVELLNKSGGMKRVVRAIEKRPKLLFLVRLAPYPYNLMNTLLASSPTLTLRTYTICTALSLPKLLVHCALGTSIKNFAAYNGASTSPSSPLGDSDGNVPPLIGYDPSIDDSSSSGNAEAIKTIFGFAGVGLCIGIFIYLFRVASKAVDEELDDEDEMDEYGVVLSDEDEYEEEEDEESSELDHDELSIAARMSNESNKETNMLNRRSSLPASTNIQSAQTASRIIFNGGSDSTLVNEMNRSYSQAGETILFSASNQKMAAEYDGTACQQYSDLSPYTYQHGNVNQSNRNHRHLDSQASLADSIVEMEKHAMEMEQKPNFHRDYYTPYADDDDVEQDSGTLRRK